MPKDPAFLFYPNDWIGGTMGMTFEEKGAYMELLMLQFNRGHMSEHMINQTVGNLWRNVKDKFEKDSDGLWYNERLDFEKHKRKQFTESRRNNRRKFNNTAHESDNNPTCLYIIKDIDTGNIKIGASVNPTNRLSTIKSRQNKNVKLLITVENCILADEKKIHENFKNFNIKGDWFDLNESVVIEYIKNDMKKHIINHMSSHMENENRNENEIDNKGLDKDRGYRGKEQERNGMKLSSWELAKSKFRSEKIYLEGLCLKYRVGMDEILKRADSFLKNLHDKDDWKDVPALKRHFSNSLNKHGVAIPDFSSGDVGRKTAIVEPPMTMTKEEMMYGWDEPPKD